MKKSQINSSINLFTISVVLACFVLQGCATINNRPPESNLSDAEIYVADELPKEFDIETIEYDLNRLSCSIIAIMKWKKEIGASTYALGHVRYYRDSAIIFLTIDGEYALAHIDRYRIFEGPNIILPSWRFFVVMDVPHKSNEVYDTKPTKKDLAQFEKDTWWRGNQLFNRDEYERIDLGICFNNINEYLE